MKDKDIRYWIFFVCLPIVFASIFLNRKINTNEYMQDERLAEAEIKIYESIERTTSLILMANKIASSTSLTGKASYYDYKIGDWSSVGHRVCATRDFPRGSFVRATNVANNKAVVCKVTDFGPDASVFPDRVIDLSSTAFSDITDLKLGIIDVRVEKL